MAEIHIKRKNKGGSLWPWILGVLVVLGLAVWLIINNTDTNREREVAQTETAAQPIDADRTEEAEVAERKAYLPDQVAGFVTFVEEQSAGAEAELNQEYTRSGLQRLEGALSELSRQAAIDDATTRQYRDRMQQASGQIPPDGQSEQPAGNIHEAVTAAADWMQTLAQQADINAGNQLGQVRQAADAINAQEPALNQPESIQAFFHRASDALQTMAPAAANQ